LRPSRPIAATFLLILLLLTTATQTAPQTITVDRILIEKSAHTMKLMHHGEILKSYKVSLSRVPIGAKERAGDHKVPEGQYIVDSKNRQSKFHLALHVSYPNVADRERAKKLGADPGGNIEIHGLDSAYAWVGSLHRTMDWTDGCIAVTNLEIEEIFPLVPVGTPVEIRP
jgi:murein L,D-transpeptidase YafK